MTSADEHKDVSEESTELRATSNETASQASNATGSSADETTTHSGAENVQADGAEFQVAVKEPSRGSLTRRALVGFCVATVACVAFGGATAAFAGESNLLRPPGGQDEKSLIAACVKCDRCRSVCPTGVISVASVNDGFLVARTPTLNFHRNYCIYCDKCREVCSTGAIKAFDPAVDKIGVAIIQRDRCLAYIQGCENCKDSCDYGALSFDSGHHPVIDADLCNGCGACEYSCTALVYGTFAGGTRRGIVVVTPEEYDEIGTTLVEGEGA